jgi:hypothetical protein
MKNLIGIVAPALTFGMGVVGRESEVEETKKASGILGDLGHALGAAGCDVALGGQMGLQEVCRENFLAEAAHGQLSDFSFYSSQKEAEENDVHVNPASVVHYVGAGKQSLANYEKMIDSCDAIIFAGGFYRAVAATLLAVHKKGIKVGILESAGGTPKALIEFLNATGLPESARERLCVDLDPGALVDKIVRKFKA